MIAKPPSRAELQRSLYRTQPRANLETLFVQSVLDYLGRLYWLDVEGLRQPWLVLRRNVGGREWIDAEGKRRLVAFGRAGMSDIYAIAPPQGTHVEIECKVPGQKPRANQQAWLEDVGRAGGIALCITSLDDLALELEYAFGMRGLPWAKSWRLE